MAHNVQIHPTQIQILIALLFNPRATYSELMNQTGLTSDHFSFHLKALIKQGFVTKTEKSTYALTTSGKEHANRLDTDNNTIERQPKTTVLLFVMKQTPDGFKALVQQRLKQPYYGFWCIPGGKIRWGETIIQAAHRELMEETGLTCQTMQLKGVYHKIDYKKDSNELLEDKIFFNVLCLNPQGELLEAFEGGRNTYMTKEEIADIEKGFTGLDHGFDLISQDSITFDEKAHYYDENEY